MQTFVSLPSLSGSTHICDKTCSLLSISDLLPHLHFLMCSSFHYAIDSHPLLRYRDRHDPQLCWQQLLQLDHLAVVHLWGQWEPRGGMLQLPTLLHGQHLLKWATVMRPNFCGLWPSSIGNPLVRLTVVSWFCKGRKKPWTLVHLRIFSWMTWGCSAMST